RSIPLPPLELAFHTLLLPVRRALARIEARLEATPDEAARPSAYSSPDDDTIAAPLWAAPSPAAPAAGLWEEIFLGSDLCADPALARDRAQLVADVISGSEAARALAGQLLLLQA